MRRTLSVALALCFVGTAAAVAAAVDPEPSPGAGPGRLAPPFAAVGEDEGERERPLRHRRGRPHRDHMLLHADGVAMNRDGETFEVRVQKGIIRAVSETSITLESPDGFTATYVIDEDTTIVERREEVEPSSLEEGEMAKVFAVADGERYVAKRIVCTGEPGPRLRAAFGADESQAA